jgi:hypothetical protein
LATAHRSADEIGSGVEKYAHRERLSVATHGRFSFFWSTEFLGNKGAREHTWREVAGRVLEIEESAGISGAIPKPK